MAPLEPADFVLQEMQQTLQEQRNLVDNVATMLQELQERASATEASASSEQEKMEELRLSMRTMKVMRDQDLHNLGVLRTDVTALQERLGRADGQLELHKSEHANAALRFGDAEGASAEMLRRMELLDGHVAAIAAGLSSTDERASAEAAKLPHLNKALASLQQEAEMAAAQRHEMAAAYGQTANLLREVIETRLPMIVTQAESEQGRLDKVSAELQTLELASDSLRARVTELETGAEVAAKETLSIKIAAQDLDAQLTLHKGQTTQQAEAAKATWKQLQDACDQVEHLKSLAEDTGRACHQVQLDVGEARKERQHHSSQLAGVSEALASLRKELRVADEEVAAVHAYLGFPPRPSTLSASSSKTATR